MINHQSHRGKKKVGLLSLPLLLAMRPKQKEIQAIKMEYDMPTKGPGRSWNRGSGDKKTIAS
jgi:hypothetical protein